MIKHLGHNIFHPDITCSSHPLNDNSCIILVFYDPKVVQNMTIKWNIPTCRLLSLIFPMLFSYFGLLQWCKIKKYHNKSRPRIPQMKPHQAQ